MTPFTPFIARLTFKLLAITTICISLTACFPGVFRPELDQGNLIDKERLAEVEIGMEPRQVRRLLGTPLLTDTFTKNRWDYYYSLRESSGKTKVHHHITVFFNNGRVSAIKDQLAHN